MSVVYERDQKVTLVGETDGEGKIFITGYHKEPSTMSAQTPKVEIGSAGTLTPPFPSGAATNAAGPIAEVPVATEAVPAPDASVPVATEATAAELPVAPEVPVAAEPTTEVPGAPEASIPPPPPVKPPKPAPMGPVSPLFTEEMNQGGRKSRRNKKTGKKQKGGKLRRKSRKQRK